MIKMIENKHFWEKETCRLCSSKNLYVVLDIGSTPVGDAYLKPEKVCRQELFPLILQSCVDCGNLQLQNIVDPEIIYRDYIYHSSDSLGLVEHFRKYADYVLNKIKPEKGALIVEIGSNDGSLLKFFQKNEMKVLGIDPALDVSERANKAGVETLPEFFNAELAKKIKSRYGTANIIIANNVFANIDDLDGLINGIYEILAPDGVFIFETGYAADLVNNLIIDNIYHEHLNYFFITPLVAFFRRNSMELVDVIQVPTKGGSIRCTVKKGNTPCKLADNVNELINGEHKSEILANKKMNEFAHKLNTIKENIRTVLLQKKAEGKSIAGYGASVGVTTFLYFLNIGNETLNFLVDDNSQRQYLVSPGKHIPVLSPDAIYRRNIDFILILAWQYSLVIIKKHKDFQLKGGKFILPLPRQEII